MNHGAHDIDIDTDHDLSEMDYANTSIDELTSSGHTIRARIRPPVKRWLLSKVLKRPIPTSLSDRLPTAQVKVLNEDLKSVDSVYLNLNIDDLCPLYIEGEGGIDLGGGIGVGLSEAVRRLLDNFPKLRLTLFAIPSCELWARQRKKSGLRYSLDISLPMHRMWLDDYKDLVRRERIEIGLHGFCHVQYENRWFSRHTEFAFKTEAQTAAVIAQGMRVFRAAGLDLTGFRQPGWDINSDLSLIDVLRENHFLYVAGSSPNAGLNGSGPLVSNIYPTLVNGLINIPQNVELDWSDTRIDEAIQQIVQRCGIVSIKAHMASPGTPNALSQQKIEKLGNLLLRIEVRYGSLIRHATLETIAAFVARKPIIRDYEPASMNCDSEEAHAAQHPTVLGRESGSRADDLASCGSPLKSHTKRPT